MNKFDLIKDYIEHIIFQKWHTQTVFSSTGIIIELAYIIPTIKRNEDMTGIFRFNNRTYTCYKQNNTQTVIIEMLSPLTKRHLLKKYKRNRNYNIVYSIHKFLYIHSDYIDFDKCEIAFFNSL